MVGLPAQQVARGLQTVSVWKDARALGSRAAEVAVALAEGRRASTLRGVTTWSAGPSKIALDSILLTPEPITRDRLDLVIDAGWVSREVVCRGIGEDPPAACR